MPPPKKRQSLRHQARARRAALSDAAASDPEAPARSDSESSQELSEKRGRMLRRKGPFGRLCASVDNPSLRTPRGVSLIPGGAICAWPLIAAGAIRPFEMGGPDLERAFPFPRDRILSQASKWETGDQAASNCRGACRRPARRARLGLRVRLHWEHGRSPATGAGERQKHSAANH